MALTHQALKTAVWMAQNGGGVSPTPEHICPSYLFEAVVAELVRAGYGQSQKDHTGENFAMNSAHLHVGQTKVRKYRTDAAQMRLLEWVRDHEDKGASLDVADSSIAEDFTGHIARDEFAKADKLLRNEGFIKGTGAWGGGTIRPEITAAGSRCLDSGYAPSDLAPGQTTMQNVNAPTYTNNINGDVGGIQQGDYNSMRVEQTNNPDLTEALDTIGRMKQLILDDELDESARSQTLILHQELEDSVRSKKSATVINAFIAAIAAQVTTFVGSQIGDLGEQLLQLPWFG